MVHSHGRRSTRFVHHRARGNLIGRNRCLLNPDRMSRRNSLRATESSQDYEEGLGSNFGYPERNSDHKFMGDLTQFDVKAKSWGASRRRENVPGIGQLASNFSCSIL